MERASGMRWRCIQFGFVHDRARVGRTGRLYSFSRCRKLKGELANPGTTKCFTFSLNLGLGFVLSATQERRSLRYPESVDRTSIFYFYVDFVSDRSHEKFAGSLSHQLQEKGRRRRTPTTEAALSQMPSKKANCKVGIGYRTLPVAHRAKYFPP